MFSFFFVLLLAEANAFSFINDTYDAFSGEMIQNKTEQVFSFFSERISTFFTFKTFFFVVVSLLVFYFAYSLFKLVFWPIYWIFVFLFPKCLIRRYQVLVGASKRRTIFAQGEMEPGTSGVSKTIDTIPTNNDSMSSTVDPYSEMVKEITPQTTANASVVGDDVQCNGTRNTMFSGEVMRATLPYRRRRPPSDMIYKSNSSEYNTNALVDSFLINNSATPGLMVYNNSIANLIAASPKFNFIRTLWTYWRFGVKVTIQPTVNPMASGVFAASISSYPSFDPLTINARQVWYRNLGCFPTVYMQCSSNAHAELVIPDAVLDRWLNNEYISGASTITLQSMTLGHIGVFCICPYNTNTGGPSAIRYNVYVQLVDVHCKWPQVARFLTQGIIDINTSVNVIDKMRDSSLPVDMKGGEGAISASGFGFDYPSDTRQYQGMWRRVFQKMHATRGKLDVVRATFNQCDTAAFPFVGEDQMSIKWLMSRQNFVRAQVISTSNIPFDLIFSQRIIPDVLDVNNDTDSIQTGLFQLGQFMEFDEIVFTFYVPKVPFQNGKYLVTLTSGVNTPPQLTSAYLNMASAPSLVIDLSAPGAVHEFRVPFTLLSEFFPSGQSTVFQRHAIPRIAMYTINPITATLTAPSSVYFSMWRHFENYRIVQPTNNFVTQAGDCTSTGCAVNIQPDSVFTRKIDDAISIKQLMEPFVFAAIYELKLDSTKDCSLTITTSALLRSLPFGQWYRFFNGSIRLGLHIIPYYEGAPTDRIDQILLTFSRRTVGGITSPFGKLLNDQPVVGAVVTQTQNFQSLTYASTTGNYFPGYPQFPVLLDTQHERMVFTEIPLVGPNGYVDLSPKDTTSQSADGLAITIAIDPIFKGSYVDGTILKTMLWVAAGDDLQAWGFNPMLSGSTSKVGGMPFETVGGTRVPVLPALGTTPLYPV